MRWMPSTSRRAEFLALDAQLHLALAEASGNVVIAAMMAGLRTAIESYVQAGAAGIAEWDAAADRLRRGAPLRSSTPSTRATPRVPAPSSTTTSPATTPKRASPAPND